MQSLTAVSNTYQHIGFYARVSSHNFRMKHLQGKSIKYLDLHPQMNGRYDFNLYDYMKSELSSNRQTHTHIQD